MKTDKKSTENLTQCGNKSKPLLGVVFRWYKQRKCIHDWRNKGFGTMEHNYASTTERRCVKCKKIEFNVMLK